MFDGQFQIISHVVNIALISVNSEILNNNNNNKGMIQYLNPLQNGIIHVLLHPFKVNKGEPVCVCPC